MRKFDSCLRTLFFFITVIILVSGCKTESGKGSWKDYGGSPDQSKYVLAEDINKSNVAQLDVAWSYSTGDERIYQWNPIVVDTIMYVLAKNSSLVALNVITGKEIWIHSNLRGIASRGINYWESKDRKDRRLLFQMNNYLQAIDALTGKSVLTFGNKGLVDLKEGLGYDPKTIGRVQSNTPGKVFENLLLLGSAPGESYISPAGHLRAYDVITGKLVWIFHTVPQPGEYGYDTWPKDAYKYIGGVNTWGEISVDEKEASLIIPWALLLMIIMVPTGLEKNLFGNSILALDARTGKRLWHFQTVHMICGIMILPLHLN
ncbi:MAG: PQQ-binding-like beta-propeller repeat protein [Bacteroidia bacterium]|nr:PQQ-binding-like beta-propeller repeat protein [Bacteroidia bacterium]